jgi:magnesium-transporting ATPase (P-type)
LDADGPNELPKERPPSPLRIFLRQFASPLIYILLLAAIIAFAAGDPADAGFVGVVLLVNALIGGYQEWKAERSSRALQALLQIKATVVRDGTAREIPAEQVVVGDMVWIESGARVPADLRLVASHGLQVDESLLTGESLAVEKDAGFAGDDNTPIAEQRNMCFAGSMVARGRGEGVVVATGARTTIGRLAVAVMGAAGSRAPLLERMERFSRMVALVVLAAAIAIGILGVAVHQYGLVQMVLFGVALAVAAIPEGLPITITVALAVATSRMARRGAIVRRLAAVEGLGSCTFIVSDKTGTLTVNELTVREVRLGDGTSFEVTGEGFSPDGEVRPRGEQTGERSQELRELARVAALCNEGSLHRDGAGKITWRGDPTDVALLAFAQKLGLEREALFVELPQINEIPFEAEHRFAATYHRHAGGVVAMVKGAPERVLAMCTLDEEGRARAQATAQAMAERGFRVLALAEGEDPSVSPEGVPAEPRGLRLRGFVGMIDPLRPGVREAVESCHRAGITVCMATGDHPVTALAIARELGLAASADQVVTGAEVAAASPERLRELLEHVRVFARMAPNQKLDVVRAAQAQGHFVAVTGDGVNDAPALKAANIGVAMGRAGTDVAREAAELVLSDDDFKTIVAGVEEGRVAYDNIRKVIFLLSSTGAAEVLLLGFAVVSGVPLPLLPVQILWLNLVTSGIQDKPLALEPAEGDVLGRPPRPPQQSVFDRLMIERTLVVATAMAAVGFSVFVWALRHGHDETTARNLLLLLLVLMKTFHLGAARSETRNAFAVAPWKNPLIIAGGALAVGVHFAAMYLPWARSILQTEPVALEVLVPLVAVAFVVFLVMELHKALWRWRHPAPRS